MSSIFDNHGKTGLLDYLNRCARIRPLDKQAAYQAALDCIKYYRGDQSARDRLLPLMRMENRWYESLENGAPDYSVYDDDCYISDIWACWTIYSRKYLLEIQKSNSLSSSSSRQISIAQDINAQQLIIDLGCGHGYTSAGLKEIFPAAEVIATNLEGTMQFQVASALGAERGFKVLPSITSDYAADLIFASEYFEHIYSPIDHLIDVIKKCSPRRFLIANAFTARSVGHFNYYRYGSYKIPNDKIGRFFNDTLKKFGFEKVNTKLWNNRPAYWRR